MKKLFVFCLMFAVALSSFTVFASDSDVITVTLDGEKLLFDVSPVMENDRVLVPFREIFEKLGCVVNYISDEEGEYVNATRGSSFIGLTIGSKSAYIAGKNEVLDVEPKIVDGRTLVPVRAVAEGLDTDVTWNDETNTVVIETKGQHKIRPQRIEKVITSDDGTDILYITAVYPVIDEGSEDSFIKDLQKEYREFAYKFIEDSENEYSEDAKMFYTEYNDSFYPLELHLTYDVNINRNNWLSLTNCIYANTHGAHPNTERVSRNFNTALCKELSLTDVLKGEEEEITNLVIEKFKEYMRNNSYNYSTDTDKIIEDEAKNIHFYISDDSVSLYFDVYQIAPYVFGYPTVELFYNENDEYIDIDLSKDEPKEFEFGLKGNPTTGYTWEVFADEDYIDVKSEYISDENDGNLSGVGGTYNFTVTGKKQGKTTAVFKYLRLWEGEKSVIKTVEYTFEISADNGIMVVDRTEKDS